MCRIEMAHVAVNIAREHGDRRMLFAFLIFTRKVAFESIAATTQEPQVMPTAPATMLAQGREIGGGNDREIDILSQMIGHTIKPRRSTSCTSDMLSFDLCRT